MAKDGFIGLIILGRLGVLAKDSHRFATDGCPTVKGCRSFARSNFQLKTPKKLLRETISQWKKLVAVLREGIVSSRKLVAVLREGIVSSRKLVAVLREGIVSSRKLAAVLREGFGKHLYETLEKKQGVVELFLMFFKDNQKLKTPIGNLLIW